MTKEEILKAIRACARELKRNPNKSELRAMAGISERALYKRLGSLRQALEAAGLQASGAGFRETEETLLLDWATAAKKLKKLPSVMEYQRVGRFSGTPFQKRWGSWMRVPQAFQDFARKRKLARQWREVLRMIARGQAEAADGDRNAKDALVFLQRNTQGKARGNRSAHGNGIVNGRRNVNGRGRTLPGRPVYGMPLGLPELAYAPTNEMGVMFLFALMARQLGFVVQRLQMGFPDCEAMRKTAKGLCQRVWIEFEFESRNFAKHRHRHDGCDLIVCWVHNWKECPLEVIELKTAIGDQLSAIS